MNPIDDMKLECEPADPGDADDLARLMGEIFSRRDPPAYAVGITTAEFEAFARLVCPQAIPQGLTWVARRADTGERIGVMLAEDCASPMPDGIDRLSRKFEPILDILGQLGAEYWGDKPPRTGESLHLFLLGVADEFGGRGIAQQLVAKCLDHGARRGYRRAVTEATNKVSQHVFSKLGFKEQVRRSYQDHRFDGRAYFNSIVGEGGPILMDRLLTSVERLR